MSETTTLKIKNDDKTFWPDDISEMYAKFGITNGVQKLSPEMLRSYLEFRLKMLQEEVDEARKAFNENDADGIVDAMIDISVFAIGTLDNFEINAYKAWNEVHRANGSKEPGIKANRPNPFGLPDLMKPNGWTSPDHSDNVGRLPEALK